MWFKNIVCAFAEEIHLTIRSFKNYSNVIPSFSLSPRDYLRMMNSSSWVEDRWQLSFVDSNKLKKCFNSVISTSETHQKPLIHTLLLCCCSLLLNKLFTVSTRPQTSWLRSNTNSLIQCTWIKPSKLIEDRQVALHSYSWCKSEQKQPWRQKDFDLKGQLLATERFNESKH